MTREEIFQAGRDGFKRGWKNIPPYSIAKIRLTGKPSAAIIWQDGWRYERDILYNLSAI